MPLMVFIRNRTLSRTRLRRPAYRTFYVRDICEESEAKMSSHMLSVIMGPESSFVGAENSRENSGSSKECPENLGVFPTVPCLS